MERMIESRDIKHIVCVERIKYLEEENKKLKEMSGKLGEMNGKLGEWVNNLEQENKKLKEEIEWYKKQYEHSMGEDEGKLVKGGYASFNEYGELMEEDTLQELRDLGEI